jgi:hypothetical protein
MSNLVSFTTARKQSRGELLAGWLDGGEIRIYDATPTLLVTFDIPAPSGTVTDGVFTADSIAASLVAETGTAASATVVDSAAVTVFTCDVGVTGSGALVQLDNLSLVQGGYAAVISFALIER